LGKFINFGGDAMVLNPVFERFVAKSPISVMARGTIERVLNPEQLNEWFNNTAQKQYTRELLFSSIFDIMSQVVLDSHQSVNAAYQASEEEIAVSVTSVYNKLNGIETNTSAELVRYASGQIAPVIKKLNGAVKPLLPGFHLKLLDGNCIEASEHRIEELRSIAAGALPGKALVVYDPSLRIPSDVFLCEDGHAQERSLLGDVLPTVKAKDLWISDRNFCVRSFLCGIADKGAYFINRLHANFPWESLGKEKYVGKIETGKVYEQPILVVDEAGKEWKFRLIRVCLKKATRDGDKEIFIVANLSKSAAHAKKIADLYRNRWKIETAFQELTEHLNSEINTLGYPPAALFGFCVALVSYMILSVIKAALSSAYGAETVDNKVSGYYLADEISGTYRGMVIAIGDEEWVEFRNFSQSEFVMILKQLAKKVKLSRFRKHPRGPKKPAPKRKFDPKHPHVSTARLLASRKKR
jgi:IS4 transposase